MKNTNTLADENCLKCGGTMIFDDVCFEDDGTIMGIYKCETRCDLDFLFTPLPNESKDTPEDPLEEDEPPLELPF